MMLCSMHGSLIASTTFIFVAVVLMQTGETLVRHTATRCRNTIGAKAIANDVGVVAKARSTKGANDKLPSNNGRKQKKQFIVGSPKVPLYQTIHYWMAAEHNATDREMMRQYLGELQSETCLQFQESPIPLASGVSFVNGSDCSATPIYMATAVNSINMHSQCLVQRSLIHEIMHMMGFHHEQQRPDAHLYVTPNISNILPYAQQQFLEINTLDTLDTPYDMGSIMHYAATSGRIKNGVGPTMTTINPQFQKTIGQRLKISFLDAYKINKVHCGSVCSAAATKCQNGGYPDVNNCQICKCPSGFGGSLCEELGKSDAGCGGTLIAENQSKSITLIDPVANKDFLYSECNWLIKCKDPGHVLLVTFFEDFGLPCSEDDDFGICQTSYLELKVFRDQRATGIRLCCTSLRYKQKETVQANEQSLLLFRNHEGKSKLRDIRVEIQQVIAP